MTSSLICNYGDDKILNEYFVADTSDTEMFGSDESNLEYEPVTEPEDDRPAFDDTSGDSEDEIIKTNRITVTMGDDGELEFADSEQTSSNESDSEIDLLGYDRCARCHSSEHNTFYRYCHDCFKAKKTFFPPRPKARKRKAPENSDTIPRSSSQDSGFESLNSQKSQVGSSKLGLGSGVELKWGSNGRRARKRRTSSERSGGSESSSKKRRHTDENCPSDLESTVKKRRSKNDHDLPRTGSSAKKQRSTDENNHSGSDSGTKTLSLTDDNDHSSTESSGKQFKSANDKDTVQPIIKSISEPSVSVHAASASKDDESKDLCIICYVRPKSGVFAHGRLAHICCCYKCAVKVWSTSKRCPVCNSKVSNVLRAVVM